jgi:FtsH-binding integral membrane protein
MYKVYGWMASALIVTGLTAYTVASTPRLYMAILTSRWILFGLMIAQFVCVITLATLLPRMNFATAFAFFIGYSVLTGLTVSSIFLVYTTSSIATTFFVASGMFATMATYGYCTKSDLSTMGNFLFMALVGLLLSLVVNLFLQSPMFNLFISAAGVLIFTLLTAFDVQKIKMIAQSGVLGGQAEKVALIGALILYLDFLNMFLFLLQFMGKRRE